MDVGSSHNFCYVYWFFIFPFDFKRFDLQKRTLTALYLHRQKRQCQQILLVEDPVTCCWTGPYNQKFNTTIRILRDVVEIGSFLDTHNVSIS